MEDWLPLPVPVEAAVNKEEVAFFSLFFRYFGNKVLLGGCV